MSNTSIESWDGLLTNFLKANDLEEDNEEFVCTNVEVQDKDMNLELERFGDKWLFGLNVTNKVFLKNAGIKVPKEVIGKKITLRKVRAMNPTLKKEVDALRISGVR